MFTSHFDYERLTDLRTLTLNPDVFLKVDIKTWKAPHHPCNRPTIGTPK